MKPYCSLLILAALLLSSCNMPEAGATPDTAVSTAAAQTIEAALANQTPLASATAAGTASPSAEGAASASFEDVTNCRTGPGVNYPPVTQIQPGVSVEIVGFFPPNFWIVKTDQGECWVAGQFVTPAGDTSAVPTVSAVPTIEGGAPENVSLQKWDIFCNYETNEANITIAWADKEEESGYRVVRNDIIVAELAANTTEFKETITLLAGQTAGYYIIAFNAAGATSSKTISMGC
ncbi:MAG: SH3 domain-containing protein [Anaerolineales bacterium]|jgi:uncharacterized protein YraI|nr:SH3 domain-containing protein [Chloroflexota bacterium]MBK6647719.1 SH3 domain-containing protein [Anaerolineales bacterium]MCC6987275.1 SH3 domain-containing protein [Anaerolineales bacterium]